MLRGCCASIVPAGGDREEMAQEWPFGPLEGLPALCLSTQVGLPDRRGRFWSAEVGGVDLGSLFRVDLGRNSTFLF